MTYDQTDDRDLLSSPHLTESLRALERVTMPDDLTDRVMDHVMNHVSPHQVLPRFRFGTIAASVLAVALATGVWLTFQPGTDNTAPMSDAQMTAQRTSDELDRMEDEHFLAQLVGVDEMTTENTLDAGDPIREIIGF